MTPNSRSPLGQISRKKLILGLWGAFIGGWTLLLTFDAPLGRVWMPVILWRYLQLEIGVALALLTFYLLRDPLLRWLSQAWAAMDHYRKAWGASWRALATIFAVAFALAAPLNRYAGSYVLDSIGKIAVSRIDYYQAVLTKAYAYGLANRGYESVRRGQLEDGLRFYDEALARSDADRFEADRDYLRARIAFARNQHDRALASKRKGLSGIAIALDVDAVRAHPGRVEYLDALMEDVVRTRILQTRLRATLNGCTVRGAAPIDAEVVIAFEPVAILVGEAGEGRQVCKALFTVCGLSATRCAADLDAVLGIRAAERACEAAAELGDMVEEDIHDRCRI